MAATILDIVMRFRRNPELEAALQAAGYEIIVTRSGSINVPLLPLTVPYTFEAAMSRAILRLKELIAQQVDFSVTPIEVDVGLTTNDDFAINSHFFEPETLAVLARLGATLCVSVYSGSRMRPGAERKPGRAESGFSTTRIRNNSLREALGSLTGQELDAVEFASNHVQLRFGPNTLTSHTSPLVLKDQRSYDCDHPGYRDAVCSLISAAMDAVSVLEGQSIDLVFRNGAQLRIRLTPDGRQPPIEPAITLALGEDEFWTA